MPNQRLREILERLTKECIFPDDSHKDLIDQALQEIQSYYQQRELTEEEIVGVVDKILRYEVRSNKWLNRVSLQVAKAIVKARKLKLERKEKMG